MNFQIEEKNYIAILNEDDLPQSCSSELLKSGIIYTGIYIMKFFYKKKSLCDDINTVCSVDDKKKCIDAFYNNYNVTLRKCNTIGLIENENQLYLRKIPLGRFTLLSLNLTKEEIITNLQMYSDTDKSSIRICYDNDQYKLIIPTDIHLNPYSIIIKLNFQYMQTSIRYLEKTLHLKKRLDFIKKNIEKYKDLKFLIENENEQFGNCSICLNIIEERENLYITSCNHNFHFDCLKEWIKYERGDQIQKTKSCCPNCNNELKSSYNFQPLNISSYNFEEYIYTICVYCDEIFSDEKNRCGENSIRRVVCNICSGPKVLQGKFFKCPNCNLLLEHNGGCKYFTCCKYGTDKCKKSSCDHGSTDFVKYCGHHWILTVNQSVDITNKLEEINIETNIPLCEYTERLHTMILENNIVN